MSDRIDRYLICPSKLLERIAAKQLIAYLEKFALLPRLQSAYRIGHSSETAVLKVLSDILLGIDAGDLSALVLLHLSAAFDTVDHHILVQHQKHSYCITGFVRQWFQSYLVGRRQFVRTGPSATLELQNIIAICIDDVARWMRSNRLQLNTAKTEVLWSLSSRRLHLLPVLPIRVGTDQVMPVSVVCNLGIYMDDDVSMRSHVSKTVAALFCVNFGVFIAQFRAPFFSHWFRPSFCSGWTMVMQRWLAFHPISPSGCSRC